MMKLFSKAKDLYHGVRKNDPFDRKAKDLFDGERKKDPIERKAKDPLDGGRNNDVLDHVRKGDVDYIKTVDRKVLQEARDIDGNTALLIATKMGNIDLCPEILKKCPSLLYHQNNYRKTVLHEATDPSNLTRKKILFIDLFVTAGVDELATSNEEDKYMKFKRWMNMQSVIGDTALVMAARDGNLQVVKRFIEVDRQYNLGLSKVGYMGRKTALNWAVEREDHEMVKLLTDEGDPYSDFVPYSTARDLFGRVRRGDLDYIKTVELNVLLNSRDKHRMSVLSIATKCNKLDCCKEIVNRCPSLLYHQNSDKWSILHHAAFLRIYRLIDFFVSAGLEAAKSEGGMESMIRLKKWIRLQNKSGDTVLVLALNRGCPDIVKRFAEVDYQYKLGLFEIDGNKNTTALQWAMYYDDQEMINMMTDMEEALQTGNSRSIGVARESNIFTLAEVSKHNNLKDCWLLINNKVYDATKFLRDHPGGSEALVKASGKDATNDFMKVHSHSGKAVIMMDKFYVGVCDSITSSLCKLASDKPQPYSLVQLKEFTKDFSQSLGSGGFGDVYKGQFPNGVFIAVKVLKNIEFNEKVMEEQFVAEVDTMGRAYHRNLIKLYGYCYEVNTKFKALVYDYMENGSLDKILFEKKLDIPWIKLHNIAKQIAHGISYLHESCFPQIIHQDIKPSNVLLDSNLSPKIIDFGLAKVNMGESQFEQTKIKGSRDYMAPEVNQPQQVKLSCKVDVYSFGKVLFDILGSKRNHVNRSGFPGLVWEKYQTNQLDKIVLDCGIKKEDKENAKRLAVVALLCAEHNPRARPMLSNVVKMLEGSIKLDTPVAPFYPDYYSSESSSMSDSRDY